MRLIIILAIVLAIYLVVQMKIDGKCEEAFGKRGGFGSKSISKGGGGSRAGIGYYSSGRLDDSRYHGLLTAVGAVLGIGLGILLYR